MSEQPIRLLIIDDHRIVREGIQSLMEDVPDIEVVGTAADGCIGVDLADRLRPDVVLMDLVMPCMDGVQATLLLADRYPDMRILVLTSFITQDKVFPAIKAGASGYLLKDTGSSELIDGIRQAYRGETSLDPKIAGMVMAEISHPAEHDKLGPDSLTERETEVLRLVAQGMSNKEIAEQLGISPETSRTHVNRIIGKLHVASRVQATLYALRSGIANLDDAT
ncbi:MAG: response regulator transcription factor [Caldilineales bacterium]